MKMLFRVILLVVALLQGARDSHAADLDLLFNREVESLGQVSGTSPIQIEGATGGKALALSSTARILWGLRLPAGEYTLLLRSFAPAGDQDGFYVLIGTKRTRRTARIGDWGVLAYPFKLVEEGIVTCVIQGQEPGVTVDRVAVAKGHVADNAVDLASAAETGSDILAELDDLPRLESACRLADRADMTPLDTENTVYAQDFEMSVRQGVQGSHDLTQGKWGKALVLKMPDGRFDVTLNDTPLSTTGTISWWVRPRPAIQAWSDQGWHWFLHVGGDDTSGIRLDLSRHISTGLQFSVSTPGQAHAEALQMDTRGVDEQAWHQLLVSWDFSGEKQFLWLLLDGQGLQLRMPAVVDDPGSLTRLVFGNTPPADERPYLPMDGAIDHIRVSDQPVRDRLEP